MREHRAPVREERKKDIKKVRDKTEAREMLWCEAPGIRSLENIPPVTFSPFQPLAQTGVTQNGKNQTSGRAGVF